MIIQTKPVQTYLKLLLARKASMLRKKNKLGKLVSVVIGNQPEQDSYVKIKTKVGNEVGIKVEKLALKENITQAELEHILKKLSSNEEISGVIIQQPIPKSLNQEKAYKSLSKRVEIEGHNQNSNFIFPLVQACMIGLWLSKNICEEKDITKECEQLDLPYQPNEELICWLKNINVAIAGNGLTTGKQISKYLTGLKIPYLQTDSKSENTDEIYSNADIIITGVGKEILTSRNIKKGVILLNFGLRNKKIKEDGIIKNRLVGDYEEDDISSKASLYTKTPGGLGPIDVLCLLGNLLKAAENS